MPTESQLQDVALRDLIRRLIDEGRLPLFLANKISAGYGSGSKCNGCDQPVTRTQIEYDLEDPGSGTAHLILHLGCYVLWQIECVKRIRARNQSSLLN